ncbi:LacI family DNA-binding transcriptional regulator [Actinopolymorpha sp. B17G11]|uniref:LacI family DNA-binding transcriptional regulator n=1 Tax=Actinopolymorpha sp. B17G11 TaxID=3160861 RepID=UPI0032E3B21A
MTGPDLRRGPNEALGAAGPTPTHRRMPTIDDVAKLAGVSRGTVSRVLNGGHYVSPGALAAVQRAVRDSGYMVNASARSLVTKRSNAVAFVLSEPQERLFTDPNFSVLLPACTQALAAEGLSLILMVAADEEERNRVLRYVHSRHVDGVLLVSTHGGDPVFGALQRSQIPAVACGRPLDHEVTIPFVSADDREGGRQMTRYLRERGHQHIAIIGGPQDTAGGYDRLQGYRDILGRRALKRLTVCTPDFGYEAGKRAMRELIGANPDIDAVFAASDLLASGALTTLRRSGRRVPDDVAVGGFDDSSIAATSDPPLTTIRQPLEQVAKEMVEVLLALIRHEPASSRVLPTQLVVRSSA